MSKKMNIVKRLRELIESERGRSAWDRGVKVYELELLDELATALASGYIKPEEVKDPKLLEQALLNGATDWNAYSWGGCSLIYDGSIAERLCTPYELKRTRNGYRKPNSMEQWLDTQARALKQAYARIKRHVMEG